jgi:enoyl-CoA hydratase/carnithine racemase
MNDLITLDIVYLDTVNGEDIHYATITLNNPPHFWSRHLLPWGTPIVEHRFNPEAIRRMGSILDKIESMRSSLGGVILTGEGKYFSNGIDIQYLQHHNQDANRVQQGVEMIMARLLSLGLVTVCVMNGHTAAAGALLSLCCDYRIMGERGLFVLPAVQLGIAYSQGFVEVAKSKISNPSTLRNMLLWGRKYDSKQLLDLGIVDAIGAVETGIDYIRNNWQKHRDSLAEVKRRMYHTALQALTDERVSDMHWDRVLSRSKL